MTAQLLLQALLLCIIAGWISVAVVIYFCLIMISAPRAQVDGWSPEAIAFAWPILALALIVREIQLARARRRRPPGDIFPKTDELLEHMRDNPAWGKGGSRYFDVRTERRED